MKKAILFLSLSLWTLSSLATTSTYTLNQQILNGRDVLFLKFSGPGAWDNYLTMNLPFAPAYSLLEQVMEKENLILKDRDEAHITVITPVEYWNILRLKNVSMKEINDIAESMQVQNSKFKVVCLGSGSALVKGVVERTFYVVVESQDLLTLRQKIQDLYISKGGKPSDFNPLNYYPHITLGYTESDLHESNGVIKGSNSCIDSIQLIR